jgi:hypothetical protein
MGPCCSSANGNDCVIDIGLVHVGSYIKNANRRFESAIDVVFIDDHENWTSPSAACVLHSPCTLFTSVLQYFRITRSGVPNAFLARSSSYRPS